MNVTSETTDALAARISKALRKYRLMLSASGTTRESLTALNDRIQKASQTSRQALPPTEQNPSLRNLLIVCVAMLIKVPVPSCDTCLVVEFRQGMHFWMASS